MRTLQAPEARIEDAATTAKDASAIKAMLPVCLAFAVVMLGTTLPTPMYTLYAAELGFGIDTSAMIFATYAAGVIAALILFGRWSDFLGRRPLLLAGLACSAASSSVFLTAESVAQLLLGRGLSGLSAGLFTGTATAMIAEAAPSSWKTRAVVVAGVTNIGGLGIGPILSGALVQYGPWPLRVVFAVHLALLGLAVLAIGRTAETVAPQPHSRLTVQRLSVPPGTGLAFLRAALAAFAGFCVIGLFASVVPTFLTQSLQVHNKLIAGVLVSTVFAASAGAQIASRGWPVTAALILGCAGLTLSALLIGVALTIGSVPALIAAAAVGGAGQGVSFTKGLGALVRTAPASRRGEIASSYFLVAYLAISIPVVGVGLAARHWSLSRIGLVFGTLVAVVAMLSLLGTVLADRFPTRPTRRPNSGRYRKY
ncbi:putative arabinose efflux permease, MFS family [Nocardia amikacinitolerans]|uniref:MFS transporter n=1 Tax=Nocardia amikacinitolerans TaxID=756689 RepID=UPI000ACFA25A|nr:MFS transporter [Nocardia amikacinitolerans]MCP2316001.1 putative arabinose efflux permease, MFS family [Nocardia amikacinitolerans]